MGNSNSICCKTGTQAAIQQEAVDNTEETNSTVNNNAPLSPPVSNEQKKNDNLVKKNVGKAGFHNLVNNTKKETPTSSTAAATSISQQSDKVEDQNESIAANLTPSHLVDMEKLKNTQYDSIELESDNKPNNSSANVEEGSSSSNIPNVTLLQPQSQEEVEELGASYCGNRIDEVTDNLVAQIEAGNDALERVGKIMKDTSAIVREMREENEKYLQKFHESQERIDEMDKEIDERQERIDQQVKSNAELLKKLLENE